MKALAPLPVDIRLMNKVSALLLTLCVLAGLASGLWWMLRHPAFALKLITVEGEVSRNNALTLKTNVVPQLKGNFFTLDLAQTRQVFETVPWVRSAVIHREFPNRLRVRLHEQHPVALWGDEGGSALLNEQGQVFEANLGEVEADALPRLKGPVSQSPQVLGMYRILLPVLEAVDMGVDELELSPRGSWKVTTSQGVAIELGRGQPQELTALLQDFLRTLPQITSRYGRTPKSLAGADLRHKDGYALRLVGVTTTEGDPRKKP